MIPKFKAWDGNNNIMWKVTDLRYEKNGELFYIRGITDNGQSIGCSKRVAPEKFKKIKLLKPSGLPDLKGNEIYEGDIFEDGSVVRYSNGKNEYAGMAVGFVLEYRRGESWIYLGEDNSHKWSVVVGNVYDKESDVE